MPAASFFVRLDSSFESPNDVERKAHRVQHANRTCRKVRYVGSTSPSVMSHGVCHVLRASWFYLSVQIYPNLNMTAFKAPLQAEQDWLMDCGCGASYS